MSYNSNLEAVKMFWLNLKDDIASIKNSGNVLKSIKITAALVLWAISILFGITVILEALEIITLTTVTGYLPSVMENAILAAVFWHLHTLIPD